MTQATRILVVDDDPGIRRFVGRALTTLGYEVLEAASAAQALDQVARAKPDVILLDLGLPDRNGIEVIREIGPNSSAPIIVLSARDDETGKVEALDLGASDYVTKPVGIDELTARIRVALRHRLQDEGIRPVYRHGDLTVDPVNRRVSLRGAEVHLSVKEFDLIAFLARHAGKVLTHDQILRTIWGPAHIADVQYLRVYVRSLRQKLEDDPTRPRYLLTETGVGYRLHDDGGTGVA